MLSLLVLVVSLNGCAATWHGYALADTTSVAKQIYHIQELKRIYGMEEKPPEQRVCRHYGLGFGGYSAGCS